MKKLKKISINPEKVIKNDELVNLRGGYEGGTFYCYCGFSGGYIGDCIMLTGVTLEQALQMMATHCDGAGATCSGEGCPQ